MGTEAAVCMLALTTEPRCFGVRRLDEAGSRKVFTAGLLMCVPAILSKSLAGRCMKDANRDFHTLRPSLTARFPYQVTNAVPFFMLLFPAVEQVPNDRCVAMEFHVATHILSTIHVGNVITTP
jgi:hypothetical protein